MLLPLDTKIAGKKTVKDWIDMKSMLPKSEESNLWPIIFDDFFCDRLDRYLRPIESIEKGDTFTGEGFSIMAIICSLIEFLESTYQGINYHYLRRGETLGPNEYNQSSAIFISFLINRHPFCKYFDQQMADEFYRNIRCGLLHEARTKGKWKIRIAPGKMILFKGESDEMILYRDNFLKAINEYIEWYKNELIKDEDIQKAFIRKFDSLCEE